MTPKWSGCPSDSYKKLSSHENGEHNKSSVTETTPSSRSYFGSLAVNRMCSLSAQKKDGNVYKRRKMDKDSNSLPPDEKVKETPTQSCTTSEDQCSLVQPVPSDATISNLRAGKMDLTQENIKTAEVLLMPNLGLNSSCSLPSLCPSFMVLGKKDDAESPPSNIGPTEPITEFTSARDLCIATLRKYGRITESRTRITTEEFTDHDTNHLLPCKTCGSLDHPLKMLICDSCEAAFHLSCCTPCVKELPADEWYCLPCLKKKPKSLYGKLSEGKVQPSGNINQRPHGMSHIEYMLMDSEPYVTGVRIGRDFQAEVPEWCGPTCSDDDYFKEPCKCDPAELTKLNTWKTGNQKTSSIGNWIQCREVLSSHDSDKPVVCGKWRRARLFDVQIDDWDCSCCLLWDPVHADCAVPQELDTDEVLKQLKYVNMLKSRLVNQNHKSA